MNWSTPINITRGTPIIINGFTFGGSVTVTKYFDMSGPKGGTVRFRYRENQGVDTAISEFYESCTPVEITFPEFEMTYTVIPDSKPRIDRQDLRILTWPIVQAERN